ncbi:hypothetical protein BCV72DRAFT_241025 [Rhizopus microsporus var. microsporus]|uniref:Uncharacterized protein n=2 Tax=Rhizopus microsporus TaxID=58291 RepID=A0A2G4SL00_RHIZD|nr:uncharacterized protein RHIMIDRAFT_240575 [Rhizopus microsporus ATCC 52813]ORE07736.1 hypothetical protein BCV72DRAFT_241025 [Rhizopus microsporus var. microsporus]PHZ09458.1 hypothetical protein RHIMIDRAFT_240575 [Rhizopus microsporus ATCC 52813]
MCSSKKKKQRSFFVEDKQTPIPIRVNKRKLNNEEPTQSDFAKRSKRQHNNDLTYFTCFDNSMHNYISTVILNKIRNSKKLEAGLLKAKNSLSNKTRFPPVIMTNAASFAGLETSVMRSFMENSGQKLIIELWKDYVNENFDSIAKTSRDRNLFFKKEESSSSLVESSSSGINVEEQ